MRKILSYAVAVLLGVLAVAPPIPYNFNLEVNSFLWVYLIVLTALISFFICTQKGIGLGIKSLMVYLFLDCFLSQVPFLSFTSYMVALLAVLLFFLCLYIDFQPVVNMMEAVFWLEVVIAILQHFGKDTLMSFGMPDKTVFFGTVFQQMRLGSLFAIMSPFLILKNRLYIIPLAVVAFSLGTLGFSFALAGGVIFYVLIQPETTDLGAKKGMSLAEKVCFILWAILFCVVAARTNNHIHIELIEGRWPMWGVILKTWVLDTSVNFHGYKSPLNPQIQTGPFDWIRFLFGHGMNTFNTLFPIYKYDQGAFRPAHNDFIQSLWEIGFIGGTLFNGIFVFIFYSLIKNGLFIFAAGLVIIGINRFLAFPDHMTQTVFLMVAYLALCFKVNASQN